MAALKKLVDIKNLAWFSLSF